MQSKPSPYRRGIRWFYPDRAWFVENVARLRPALLSETMGPLWKDVYHVPQGPGETRPYVLR